MLPAEPSITGLRILRLTPQDDRGSDQILTFPVVPGPILSGMPWNRIHLPAEAR